MNVYFALKKTDRCKRNLPQLTNEFSQLLDAELVTESKWHRSMAMTINAPISQAYIISHNLYYMKILHVPAFRYTSVTKQP